MASSPNRIDKVGARVGIYSSAALAEALSECALDFGLNDHLASVDSVFIKPNFVSDSDEHIRVHCNTETELIAAILEFLSNFDLRVYLGESEVNRGSIGRRVDAVMEKMGIYELQRRYDFEIVNLTTDPRKRRHSFGGSSFCSELELNEILFEVDLIVNLPKLKTHKFTTMTGSLKNYYGLIPDPFRLRYHDVLDAAIAELGALFWKKTFNVLDGIVGMEGDGPTWGTPVHMHLVLAGDHAGAVDVVAGQVMGIDWTEVAHLERFLRTTGLDPTEIQLVGNLRLEDVRTSFKRAQMTPYMKLEKRLFSKPWFHRVVLSEPSVRYLLAPLRPLIRRIRGGYCSFYLESDAQGPPAADPPPS
jgi:uncharacterized protein (DUF362 family)